MPRVLRHPSNPSVQCPRDKVQVCIWIKIHAIPFFLQIPGSSVSTRSTDMSLGVILAEFELSGFRTDKSLIRCQLTDPDFLSLFSVLLSEPNFGLVNRPLTKLHEILGSLLLKLVLTPQTTILPLPKAFPTEKEPPFPYFSNHHTSSTKSFPIEKEPPLHYISPFPTLLPSKHTIHHPNLPQYPWKIQFSIQTSIKTHET